MKQSGLSAKRNLFKYICLIFIVIVCSYKSYPQVVIKEKVEINPGIENLSVDGNISGDPRNPAYLGYGGLVTLRPVNQTHVSFELWEESLGKVDNPLQYIDTLGVFPQWHKFVFYLLDPATGQKFYPDFEIINWGWGGITIDFYPSHQPGEPYFGNPEDWWEMNLEVDYSLAAMPPEEILNYEPEDFIFLGNPFVPSDPLILPVKGNVYAVITNADGAADELWSELPQQLLLRDNLQDIVGEIIELGEMEAGDSLRFFIRSPNTIVAGLNLYPRQLYNESFTPGGSILLWQLQFEDWTDLLFDNLEIGIYLIPDSTVYQGPVAAIIEPEELAPGDTAEIKFRRRYLDGTLEDFPPEQTFEVGMVDGCLLGTLLACDGTDCYSEPYFYGIPNSFQLYFIADSLEDKGTVRLKAGLISEGGIGASRILRTDTGKNLIKYRSGTIVKTGINKEISRSEKSNNSASVENTSCFIGDFIEPVLTPFEISVESKIDTIMLGETKYYGVKKRVENGLIKGIKIEEIEVAEDSTPAFPSNAGEGWEWIKEDAVWGSNPVRIVSCDSCGKKMGIYWEKKYPKWGTYRYNGDEYLGRDFKGMEALSNGLIRLIGRYWHKDSTYFVTLNAKIISGDSASIKIHVIKPSQLVSDKESATRYGSYSFTKDVHNQTINIDSLCIYYGGTFSISPQIIKGQIHKETHKINFSGIGWGFAPSYRYEPYTTQRKRVVLEGMRNNPFFITAAINITPPNHQHVKPLEYFSGDTMTVWQIVSEYSQLVDKNRPYTLYGDRLSVDTMDFDGPGYGPTDLQEIYHSFLKNIEKVEITLADGTKRKMTFSEQADSANKRMIVYLRDEFRFYDINKTAGMKNVIAQTRIASSYGLFQAMYTTAIGKDWNYPIDSNHFPELFNEVDTNFIYAIKRQKELLKNFENKNNWPEGYEETIRKRVLKNGMEKHILRLQLRDHNYFYQRSKRGIHEILTM